MDSVQVHALKPESPWTSKTDFGAMLAVLLVSSLSWSFALLLVLSLLHCFNHCHLLGLFLLVPGFKLQPVNKKRPISKQRMKIQIYKYRK